MSKRTFFKSFMMVLVVCALLLLAVSGAAAAHQKTSYLKKGQNWNGSIAARATVKSTIEWGGNWVTCSNSSKSTKIYQSGFSVVWGSWGCSSGSGLWILQTMHVKFYRLGVLLNSVYKSKFCTSSGDVLHCTTTEQPW